MGGVSQSHRLNESQRSQRTVEVVSSDAILAGALAPSQLVQVREWVVGWVGE